MTKENAFKSLEFDKLLAIIAQYVRSDASEMFILSIKPLQCKEEIEKRFSCIKEIRRLLQDGKPLNILPFKDIMPYLLDVRPEGATLEPSQLVWIMVFLKNANEVSGQIKESPLAKFLKELTEGLTGKPELLTALKRTIDSEGNILDSASPLLKQLRAEKRRFEQKIKKRLEEIINDEKTAVFLQDTFITQRSGRWVIPVRMDSKGMVAGVVHDVSRTGETAFVEPLGIIGLSNELENVAADEKTEEIRILKELSAVIRSMSHELEDEFKMFVYLDALDSIARFSEELGMEIPEINDKNTLHLVKARHPLLLYKAKKDKGRYVVPVDVHIGEGNTIMVITGPNAGGKTVTIKTIGLLSVMALSGIPVTADSSSTIPLFQKILIDIGDSQSIEHNLSTFTAHLTNLMEILKEANPEALVLIDELGTGTDPEEGSALSCAILREMRETNACLFATTHLTGIKAFVHKEKGMINASMEFDRKTLAPLYRLRIGEPGQSFALETAERFGIPKGIIESAKELFGAKKADLDALIHELQEKRGFYEKGLVELKRQRDELIKRESAIKELLMDVEDQKREILSGAYKDASDIILDTKRQMNILLDEFKKKDRAKEVLKEVALKQGEVMEEIKRHSGSCDEILSIDEIKEGDEVFVKSLGYNAAIVKLLQKDNRLRIRIGDRELAISISDIGRKKEEPGQVSSIDIKLDISEEESVLTETDLRGLRADEALSRLERFLNHASIRGLSQVTIIHGIGTGRLSSAIREYLGGHPLVKDFRTGTQSEGGAGVTIVSLI